MSHYDVLGVSRSASADEIKRAYYRRARRFHPDAHSGASSAVVVEAARAMSSLNESWSVLRDPARRAEYDRHLALDEGSAEADAASGRGASRQAPRRTKTALPPLVVGAGFRYWMGSSGAAARGEAGHARLNLGVDGATNLEPLEALAPDRLWGLHAERSLVDDRQLVHLRGMRGLQLLDLSSTRVTDAGLVHLQELDNLDALYLWDTAVTDEGLALLGVISSLRVLGLGDTAVTDRGLAHLRSLRGLRLLQLWGTKVRGPGLVHLHGLRELEIVSLPRRVGWHHRRRLRRALGRGTLVD